ncbi:MULTISPECIES: competence protein ComK [Bacillaceae]|uniref:competence protein ComK n=1 Tax=Bacillaceae TaxID=186817 RepID=UPI003000DC1C
MNNLKQQIKEYEVHSSTMYLAPMKYGSKIFTRIVETDSEFLAPFKPLEIIKRSCEYFGVDYESRKKGTRQLIGYNRKIPITIEPTNRLFFFPTSSPNHPDCIWFSHEHIEKFERIAPNQTFITFRNEQSFQFPVPISTIEGQMLRTSYLKTKLLQRIEGNKKLLYVTNQQNLFKASEGALEYIE